MNLPELLWLDEWYQEGESPWSVLQKLKLANHARSNELLSYLGTLSVKKRNKLWLSRSLGNLWGMEDFDDDVLQRNLLKKVKIQNHQLIEQIVNRLNVRDDACWHKDLLQFCPVCLSQGYHSIIHQLRLLYECPFHNKPLRTSCENCGARYHYHLYEENMATPFVCNCGHSYLPTLEFVRLHTLFSDQMNHKESLEAFLDKLNPTSRMKHYFPNNLHYKQYANPIKTFLSMQEKASKGKGTSIQLTSKRKRVNYNPIIPQQRAVFKSIARQLRKKFLKKHRKCLKEMKHGILRRGVCCYALVYLNWRKDIEGDYSYFEVDRGPRKNVRGNHSSTFYTHIHEGFLEDIFTWMDQQLPKDQKGNDLVTIQWVLNRIYPMLVLYHFYWWSKAVESLIKPEDELLVVKRLPFPETTDLPFFLFSYNNNDKRLTFHRDFFKVQFRRYLFCYKNDETHSF
jgi:hypothetical protein